MGNEEMKCPFCNEGGFDSIGLKRHLLIGWCDAFNDVPPDDCSSSNPNPTVEEERS